MATVLTKSDSPSSTETDLSAHSTNDVYGGEKTDGVTIATGEDIPPLGAPKEEKRFWVQRTKHYNPDAIATQVSVFVKYR